MSDGWVLLGPGSVFESGSWGADLGPIFHRDQMGSVGWLPDEAEEIDLIATLPVPGGVAALDPTDYFGTYRVRGYHGAPDIVGDFSFGDPGFHSGEHLFVILWARNYVDPSLVTPSRPPLGLVPSSIIDAGYGPYTTTGGAPVYPCAGGGAGTLVTDPGHWSAWQSGYLTDSAASGAAIGQVAQVEYLARKDFRTRTSTSSLADAISAAIADIAAGTVDSTVNPGAVIGSYVDASYAKSGATYTAQVGLGYEAITVAPGSDFLPVYFITTGDHLAGVEGLDYGEVPIAERGQFHNLSPLDVLDGRYLIDWEEPGGAWQHWSDQDFGSNFNVVSDAFSNLGSGTPAAWHGGQILDGRTIGATFLERDLHVAASGTTVFSPHLGPARPSPSYERSVYWSMFVTQDSSRHFKAVTSVDLAILLSPVDIADIPSWPDQFTLYTYAVYDPVRFSELAPLPYPPDSLLTPNLIETAYSYGTSDGLDAVRIQAVFRTPRWRYWIPDRHRIVCEAPPLRSTQRDDGRGAFGHARLNTQSEAPNQATSTQHGHAPRIATTGRYS